MQAAFKPRQGLRADCLKNPRGVWNTALGYCFANTNKGDTAARKWAYGIWHGIYPDSNLPYGLYLADCDQASIREDEWGLIEREVKRFRDQKKRRAA